jgi:BASS family bile acid:Na+ symporter
MELASLVPLVLQACIMMTVVALGLEANIADIIALLRKPAQIARSLVAMFVLMPVLAVGLSAGFDLHPAVKVALVALALSPVPPILPRKQLKAGGRSDYVHGLLVTAALFAIVFVPLALEVVERIFAIPLHLPPLRVAKIVLITILAPLAAGLVVRGVAPALAVRIARPLAFVATVLLGAAVVLILVKSWPAMVSLIGNGTLAAFAVFAVAGLAVGHLLGGPDPKDRGVLAFATATRHPGVALSIASVNFSDQKLVLPAVLLFMIVGTVLSIPYMKWLERRGG